MNVELLMCVSVMVFLFFFINSATADTSGHEFLRRSVG